MAISHADFFRILPAALNTMDYCVTQNSVVVEEASRSLRINLSEERERRIALLALPVTDVELVFTGYSEADIENFLARFHDCYRRGGG
jgi:hypothetical protein